MDPPSRCYLSDCSQHRLLRLLESCVSLWYSSVYCTSWGFVWLTQSLSHCPEKKNPTSQFIQYLLCVSELGPHVTGLVLSSLLLGSDGTFNSWGGGEVWGCCWHLLKGIVGFLHLFSLSPGCCLLRSLFCVLCWHKYKAIGPQTMNSELRNP